MLTYQLATRIRLATLFTDKTLAGNPPGDPTTITVYIKDPAGVVTQHTFASGDVARTGIGAYQYDFTPGALGTWRYKWQGEGALEVTSEDKLFRVAESEVVTPWP